MDKLNRETKWQDCTMLEMQQLAEYGTFSDLSIDTPDLTGFKHRRVHLVFEWTRHMVDGHWERPPQVKDKGETHHQGWGGVRPRPGRQHPSHHQGLGLHSSRLRWWECFLDCLQAKVFTPCKAEPNLWVLGENEYVAVYVDNLAFSMKDPKAFTDTLMNVYNFKLKGTSPYCSTLVVTYTR